MKKRIISLILLALLPILFVPGRGNISLSAQLDTQKAADSTIGKVKSKEEVVYASLDQSGEVKKIYTVNILNISEPGLITDYGSYSSVKNLTNTGIIENKDNRVSVKATAGRFYYQGNMTDVDLPWNITISYSLDEAGITASELAGKSGKLKIHIKTEQNPITDASFFQHFLLQISLTFDTETCSGITAPGATLANSGSNKLVNFTVMPGCVGDVTVEATVSDFEMNGIEFSAVPYSFSFELPDTSELTDELTLLSGAIVQLNSGIVAVKDGVSTLQSGISEIKTGSTGFMSGLHQIDVQSTELRNASQKISNSLTQISSSLRRTLSDRDFDSLTNLPAALSTLATGLNDIAQSLTQLCSGYTSAYQAWNRSVAALPEADITTEDLAALMEQNPGNNTLNRLIEYYKAARTVKKTYQAVAPAFSAVNDNLAALGTSVNTVASSLATIAGDLLAALGGTDETGLQASITQLSSGIAKLADSYGEFDEGLGIYIGGISELQSSYSQLDTGLAGLSGGVDDLSSGLKELAEGGHELQSRTAGMPGQVDTAIDNILASYDTTDYRPVSFAAQENKDVKSVQFVFRTDKIEKALPVLQQEPKDKKENFWTRLKALFVKTKG